MIIFIGIILKEGRGPNVLQRDFSGTIRQKRKAIDISKVDIEAFIF